MNKKTVLFYIPAAALTACHPQQKQGYAGVEGDTVNGVPLPERQEGTSFFGSNVSRNQFPPVYFAYDSSEIQSSETGKLRQIADFLKRAPNNIILAGFTDEPGTEEYNRAPGEKRSKANKTYVIWLGVSGPRIETVSLGWEMRGNRGNSHAVWAKNRRPETGVIK